MEWVETTGRSVEEAKDAALDQLGVDEADAEFEVVAEARSGLFGRLRQEARVRARVRPTTPPPKLERRDRRKRAGRDKDVKEARPAKAPASSGEGPGSGRGRSRSGGGDGRTPRPAVAEEAPVSADVPTPADEDVDPVSPAQVGEAASEFVRGLVDAFGVEGETSVAELDPDTLEVRVEGGDLGLLVGPKGATLSAVQELTRTVTSRVEPGGRNVRIHVDVAGYRARRREALERFTQQVAAQVLETGTTTAMEPMAAADRKVVHDTANAIAGVHTTSEGEEPRRRVVLHAGDEPGD